MFWKKAHTRYRHLTAEDDDIRKWPGVSHLVLNDSYKGIVGSINDIGHQWIAKHTAIGPVLEIGFGLGRQYRFFTGRLSDYYVSEYSTQYFNSEIWSKVRGRGIQCDARNLPYRSSFFQTVISVYNLEHIKELHQVLQEVSRVLKPGGYFLVALPCEGGLLWNLGREITTRRQYQKKYGINYDKIIAYEHVWDFSGVIGEIRKSKRFSIEKRDMFPFRIPTHHLNLIACLQCSVLK